MGNNNLINNFLNATARDWCAMDIRTLEHNGNPLTYDPPIARPWIQDFLLPLFDKIESLHLSPQTIAQQIDLTPTAIRCLIAFDLLMAKHSKVGVETYQKIFSFYTAVLEVLCTDDIFAYHHTNLVHTPQQVEILVNKTTVANPQIARVLGKLTNGCYNLSYGLYSDSNPQLVYNNFGPYNLGDTTICAVKTFNNLRPLEIWPETALIPFDNITVTCIFKNVTLKVDAASHATYYGDQISGLERFSCHGDGQAISLERINKSRNIIEQIGINVYTKVKSMSIAERRHLYVLQKAWGYKKLCTAVGLDWKPPRSVTQASQEVPIFNDWNMPEDPPGAINFIKDILDPRTETSPQSYI